jgi:hypothetical protein
LVGQPLGVKKGQAGAVVLAGRPGRHRPALAGRQGQAAFLLVTPQGQTVTALVVAENHGRMAAGAQAQGRPLPPLLINQTEGRPALGIQGDLNFGRPLLVPQPDMGRPGLAQAHFQPVFSGLIQHEEAGFFPHQGQKQPGPAAVIDQAQFPGRQDRLVLGPGRLGRQAGAGHTPQKPDGQGQSREAGIPTKHRILLFENISATCYYYRHDGTGH